MEAVPRLPMISFETKTCTESAAFGPSLKHYIAEAYGEDPESFINEIHNLESLRSAATRATHDVTGCQLLKKYYCQLQFLKSRFPMEELQRATVYFAWKDNYSGLACNVPDIRFELMCVLYNIGALHTELGATDTRLTPDGMKIACTHFQCAAWAFQTLKTSYHQMVSYISSVEIMTFMELVCLAQAQECILEKSMMDNRKATIIAKVSVQVVDYYKQAQTILQGTSEDGNNSDFIKQRVFKDWTKYLNFKVAYHKCIALLFQGQQAEEQQKMGERVAFYQAASEQLEAAIKLTANMDNKQELSEAMAFTSDVVEGKKKAAKNENEFIYHEEVPSKDALQEVKGASLVKGIPVNINDVEVSGPDIFARLVPMEAHEASSLYSEKKAQLLRQKGELIEDKDQSLVEFMSSLQVDVINEMRQATGIPQEIIDRAAALSARPNAIQDLISSMGKLSNSYQEVESMLNEIQELLKEEDLNEKEYQKTVGERPPSIIATDLSREAAKYREAHMKANDSNQNLHKAMTTHVGNLKQLSQPLMELQKQIPSVQIPDANVDEMCLKDIETLLGKVEEMRTQRALLWAQLREAIHTDDITSVLVTKSADEPVDAVFQRELDKHSQLTSWIDQNAGAQENIIKALIDSYARFSETRRYLQSVIGRRGSTIQQLIASFDSYEDLLAKANKGVEFYTKLETNVTKLVQRIRSACKVQQEEREQMMAKVTSRANAAAARTERNVPEYNNVSMDYTSNPETTTLSSAPKLKDYLDSMKKNNLSKVPNSQMNPSTLAAAAAAAGNLRQNPVEAQSQVWPPGVRPAPLGSEMNDTARTLQYDATGMDVGHQQHGVDSKIYAGYGYSTDTSSMAQYGIGVQPQYNPTNVIASGPAEDFAEQKLSSRLQNLKVQENMDYKSSAGVVTPSSYNPTYSQQPATYSNYVPTYYANPSSYGQVASGVAGQSQPQNSMASQMTSNASSVSQQANYISPSANQYQSNTSQYNSLGGYDYTNQTSNPLNQMSNLTNPMSNLYVSGYSTPQSSTYVQPTTDSVNYFNQAQNAQNYTSQSPTYAYGNQSYAQAQNRDSYSHNQDTYSQNQVSYSQNRELYAHNRDSYSQNRDSNFPTSSVRDSGSTTVSSNNVTGQGYTMSTGYAVSSDATNNTPMQNYVYNNQYQTDYRMDQSGPTLGAGNFYSTGNYGPDVAPPSGSVTYSQDVGYGSQYAGAAIQVPTSMYTQAGSNYIYNPNNSASSSGGVPSSQYFQTQPITPSVTSTAGAYSYISNTHVKDTVISSPQTKKDESNVDLLSGLDFSVNQAPLIPQQKKDEQEVKKTENNDVTAKSSVTTVQEESVTPIKHVEKIVSRKTLDNSEVKKLFLSEIEKYEKLVESLANKNLNGLTNLDNKWKEVQQYENDMGKKIISVARCYPMKNRFPDILPYDHSRVLLKSTKDDYINASYIKDISTYVPTIILTQAPLVSTQHEFWTMIREQHVEFVMCLLNDKEIGDDIYWPKEKGKDLSIGNLVISLQSVIVKPYWIERLISVTVPEKREFSTIVHLQFTDWPGSLFPTSPVPFVSYVKEFITLYQQQRLHFNPILIHCSPGIGRSGLACLLVTTILEVTNNATKIPETISWTNKISAYVKNPLRDREHLKFAYQSFLAYMKLVASPANPLKSDSPAQNEIDRLGTETREKDNDPLSNLDPFWASRKQ